MSQPVKPIPEDLLSQALPDLRQLLETVAALGRDRGQSVWVVGGVVRDLLLGTCTRDVDLVVLGRVEEFASALARIVGGAPRSHRRFLTVDFRSESGFEVDIVRARSERYPEAAALPSVRPGTLIEDLYRRDFTVNAMALPLSGEEGRIQDPFGGLGDLDARQLRVLHQRSFIDDPTRILRGLRLADRLKLELEPNTALLASAAVDGGAFDVLSRERLRAELAPLLMIPAATRRSLPRLLELGLDRILSPGLVFDEAVNRRLDRLDVRRERVRESGSAWLATLVAIVWELGESDLELVCDRLALGGESRELMTRLPGSVSRAGWELKRLNSPYERYRVGESLGGFGRTLAICCGDSNLAAFLDREWPTLERERPAISGADLVGLGFRAGPAIGASLEETARARLEGRIKADQELDFAARWLREKGHRAASLDIAGADADPDAEPSS